MAVFAVTVLGVLDRVPLPKRGVVIRTAPDLDDQGLEVARALDQVGVTRLVWLVKGSGAGDLPAAHRLPSGTLLVGANSFRGIFEYLRARVVVHTHGLYGIPPRSKKKTFINLWHGWGTKQLVQRPPVALRQSDIVTVTSREQAQAVSDAWAVDRERVQVTGLPRNDRMIRAADEKRPKALDELVGPSRPLILWLPTYRRSILGELRVDGREFDNDFQLPGCGRADVENLAAELDAYFIIKTHQMSLTHDLGSTSGVSVWNDEGLADADVTLYELLGHSDVLVTDYSSVWVDYLLVDRPIVFAMADRNEYGSSRGHYDDFSDTQLPGPVAQNLSELSVHLRSALEEDPWAPWRRELRGAHHLHLDGESSHRVASLVKAALGPASRSGS